MLGSPTDCPQAPASHFKRSTKRVYVDGTRAASCGGGLPASRWVKNKAACAARYDSFTDSLTASALLVAEDGSEEDGGCVEYRALVKEAYQVV